MSETSDRYSRFGFEAQRRAASAVVRAEIIPASRLGNRHQMRPRLGSGRRHPLHVQSLLYREPPLGLPGSPAPAMGPGTPTKLGTTRSRTERAGRSDVAPRKAAAPAFARQKHLKEKLDAERTYATGAQLLLKLIEDRKAEWAKRNTAPLSD